MTIRLRNRIFCSVIILYFISFISFVTLLFYEIRFSRENILDAVERQPMIINDLLSASGLLVIGAVGLCLLFKMFHRIVSGELLFFFFYAASFATEALVAWLLFTKLHYPSLVYSLLLSRLIYAGRFFGTLAFFSASLFSCGLRYHRSEVLLLLCASSSILIGMILPLDTFQSSASGLLFSGSEMSKMPTVYLVIQGLAVINLIIGWFKTNESVYLFMGTGVFLAFTGRIIIHGFSSLSFVIIGFGVLLTGLLFFGIKLREMCLRF